MSTRGGDPAWLVALSLAGLLVLLGAGFFAAHYFVMHMPKPRFAGDATDRQILADPENGRVASTIREKFPDEYVMLKGYIAALDDQEAGPEKYREAYSSFADGAIDRHRAEIGQAPHAALAAYRNAELRVIERLKAVSIEQCASYVVYGTIDEPVEDQALPALRQDARIAFWNAAADGRDTPADRAFGILSNADAVAYDKAMLADGMAEDDLVNLNALESLSEERQCAIGWHKLHAIDWLPPETGDLIYGGMLAGNN